MIYILKTEINENLNIVSGLNKIFGIGPRKIKFIIKTLGLNKSVKFKQLTPKLKNLIIQLIENNFVINDKLKREIINRRKLLTRLRTYKGLRDRYKLPRRGQRTHTNARTVSGKVKKRKKK